MQTPTDRKIVIQVPLPLLPGSLSTASSTCGQAHCACKAKPPKLHGVYYRWTGFIAGKRTTRTLSKEAAEECRRRIRNYHRLQQQIDKLVAEALAQAPWKGGQK